MQKHDRTDELRRDFKNILAKWGEALERPETEVYGDASILRFELAFEVAWKLIQKAARTEGFEVKSPRQSLLSSAR